MKTVLVANRGEIACRIMATLRERGLRSVAVYSDADAQALHVRRADAAVRLGPAEPRPSYLSAEAILAAARQAGADAIHPGYGFLAESADFAGAVAAAGLVFIGPTPEQARRFGDKRAARAAARAAGVPVVPGFEAPADAPESAFLEGARALGYPVIVKGLAALPVERLALHFHDTRGTALANVLAGLEMGVAIFDASSGGLGGCPYAPGASGNLATEDLLYMLRGMGVETGVALDQVVEASRLISRALGRELPSRYLQAVAR